MNPHIKPTFLNYIAGLEQSDLVGLLTDLVNNDSITVRVQGNVLVQNNVDLPEDDSIVKIVGHNIKKLSITYCSNYNGCGVEVIETVDGTDPEEYMTSNPEYTEISDALINLVVEHAVDECSEEGAYYGSIECLGEDVLEMTHKLLGDLDEIEFSEDNTST